ncbi:MAG: glycosyltransferase [Acidimicrobiia bacterium]|nr:glycosyltransferase [Acidimicrobiia bacterium]
MRVSIAIPTFNGSRFISDTLESVLDQTFSDFEVLVSDDGSTDDTLEIVRSYGDSRIRIVGDGGHLGAGGNWNRALTAANCEYVKLLPQDDLLYPQNLEVQVAILDGNPELAFVSVRRDVIDANGTVLTRDRGLDGLCGLRERDEVRRAIVRSGTNQLGEGAAILMRRQAADAAGSFDASLPYVIDVDFWVRLLDWGPGHGVCETHAAFRVSTSAWSSALAKEQGRQYVAFIDRLAEGDNSAISGKDAMIGRARARLNGIARRVFYVLYRRRL